MILYLYELQDIDNRKTVPVGEPVEQKMIAMSKNIYGIKLAFKIFNRLGLDGLMPKMTILEDGNVRIMYTALPKGLKFDPYYRGGTYYRGKDVFHNDVE